MIAGSNATKNGKMQEAKQAVGLKTLGFHVCDNVKSFRRETSMGAWPALLAYQGAPYNSPLRPNTKCRADWRIFEEGRLTVHCESKNQTSGGSAAAKVIAAALEVAAVAESDECIGWLILPPAKTLENFSDCDRDYYKWATDICGERDVMCGPPDDFQAWIQDQYYIPIKHTNGNHRHADSNDHPAQMLFRLD